MTPAELKAIREQLGLGVNAFAKLLGVTGGAVSRWEAGTRKIPKIAVLAVQRLNDDGA